MALIYVDPLGAVAFYRERRAARAAREAGPPRIVSPAAPVYSYEPLGDGPRRGGAPWPLPAPRHPDALVFGPQDAMELQGRGHGPSWSDCSRCGVTWQGIGHCWHCGRRP